MGVLEALESRGDYFGLLAALSAVLLAKAQ